MYHKLAKSVISSSDKSVPENYLPLSFAAISAVLDKPAMWPKCYLCHFHTG
ncbi:hypothetical protein M5D96_003113, partial [Drosophila gunungcola]